MSAVVWSPFQELEDQFNHTAATSFLRSIWHYSFYISAFYVLTIFAIQAYMRDRPKYNLRGPLMAWSLLLSMFSMYGFAIGGLAHLTHFYRYGWQSSVCDPVLVEGQTGLWSFLFCFSKCPELIDTYFIVLRKQKLIFLHWYHHITVFTYCWFSYSYMTNPQQWFITMNYFVHSIMYMYYAIRASSIYRPPIWVNMFITTLQLVQMAIGVYVNVYVFYNMKFVPYWRCDGKIETTNTYVYAAFVMYASYLVLFANFFYTTYISKKKKPSSGAKVTAFSSHHVPNGVAGGKGHSSNGSLSSNGIEPSNCPESENSVPKKELSRNGLRHRS